MKRPRSLITVLIVANLLGVLAAPLPALLLRDCVWGFWATVLMGFLAIGQVQALAVWAALWGKPTPWRLVSVVVVVVGWFSVLKATWF